MKETTTHRYPWLRGIGAIKRYFPLKIRSFLSLRDGSWIKSQIMAVFICTVILSKVENPQIGLGISATTTFLKVGHLLQPIATWQSTPITSLEDAEVILLVLPNHSLLFVTYRGWYLHRWLPWPGLKIFYQEISCTWTKMRYDIRSSDHLCFGKGVENPKEFGLPRLFTAWQ